MAWFKWYENAATDAKIQCVAKLSCQPVAFVVALWVMILERASACESRGSVAGFDCESADVALQMPEGSAERIFAAMCLKGMIEDGAVANWDRRQAVRKKAGSAQARSNAERQREYRERQKAALQPEGRNDSNENVTQRNDSNALRNVTLHNVTQRNVTLHNVTQRNAAVTEPLIKDKIRVEEIKDSSLRSESFCAEQSCDSSTLNAEPEKPLMLLPLNNGKLHAVMTGDAEHWQELYPAVDVRQELRNMLGWLEANPKKRKTPTGIKGFITRWLAGKQDKGGSPRASPGPMRAGQSEGDRAARKTWENYQNLRARGLVA